MRTQRDTGTAEQQITNIIETMENRFEFQKPQRKDLLTDALIIVDKKTGVNYLMVRSGYGAGLTPLIDAEGKPIVTK